MQTYDAVILGAGAAGLYAAGVAARRGLSVLLIDHSQTPGEKIRISGGGRCNFTNLRTRPEAFLSGNPHFAKSALARHGPEDFVALVRRHGIAFHEKTLGQLFCDGKSLQIIDMLCAELGGAELRLGTSVTEVSAEGGSYRLRLDPGGWIVTGNLVVATGGKSIPKIGASGFGYRLAEQFGLALTETRPGLVPLTFGPEQLSWMAPLAGVSLPVTARAVPGPKNEAQGGKPGRRSAAPGFEEAALFTHRGVSGPAVLQISSYWREGDEIGFTLLADALDWLRSRRQEVPKRAISTVLAERLPARLAQHLAQAWAGSHSQARPETGRAAPTPIAGRGAERPGVAAAKGAPAAMAPASGTDSGAPQQIGTLSDRSLTGIAAFLADWRLKPNGSEGYRTAEVTLGGVSTGALDARTLEAKATPGLYFIGEVVDVTGWLGGYNFQWAWSSAHACASALERR